MMESFGCVWRQRKLRSSERERERKSGVVQVLVLFG